MSHIKIYDEALCCGCSACHDACVVGAIKMNENERGFRFPQVAEEICVDCGRCISSCPVKNSEKLKHGIIDNDAVAFVAHDEDLIKGSSSGGAFSKIAEVFAKNHSDAYLIVGATVENKRVVHICIDDICQIEQLRKSKYVQSNADGAYRAAKRALTSGRAVLFSGTPCMVAALRSYLGKDYEKLLTVDIICHGVPSQRTFDTYLEDLASKLGVEISDFSFRAKRGWDHESVNPRTVDIVLANGKTLNLDISECEYLYGFHAGLYFRESCYECRFASSPRPSDITLGDFWGIEKEIPSLNSKRGVSLVRANTELGKKYTDLLSEHGDTYQMSYDFACSENDQLRAPSRAHRNRDRFFKMMRNGTAFIAAVQRCKRPPRFHEKVLYKITLMSKRIRKKLKEKKKNEK